MRNLRRHICLISWVKWFIFSPTRVHTEVTHLNICQHHLLTAAGATHFSWCRPCLFPKRSHAFKVLFCKLIILSKQTNETTTWSGAIAVAPGGEGAESRAHGEQTGSPQCSLRGMQPSRTVVDNGTQCNLDSSHGPKHTSTCCHTFISVNCCWD